MVVILHKMIGSLGYSYKTNPDEAFSMVMSVGIPGVALKIETIEQIELVEL